MTARRPARDRDPPVGLRSIVARLALAACMAPLACAAAAHAVPHAGTQARAVAALRAASCTERILKLQAQIGQRILPARARRALRQAIRQLDASVRAVGVPSGPAPLHEGGAILAILAREYRAWALKPATRDNAMGLGERAEELEWEANRVASLLMPSAGGRRRSTPAIASEAAAFAQRVARLLLWRRWGLGGDAVAGQLALARAGLRADFEALSARAGGSPEADDELQLARDQAEFLLASARRLEDGSAGPRELEFAAKAGDNIGESMDRLVALQGPLAR